MERSGIQLDREGDGGMKRRWGYLSALALFAVGLLGSIALGLWKSEARQFAESTCEPQFTDLETYRSCMAKAFRGRLRDDAIKYAQGSDFVWWANKQSGQDQLSKYVAIRDNEIRNRRIALIFVYRDDKIHDVRVFEQNSVEGTF